MAEEEPRFAESEKSEATQHQARQIQDLHAGNERQMKRLREVRGATLHPVALLAARVRALLAVSPDEASRGAADDLDAMQVVTNAVETLVISALQGEPGLVQAFSLEFEMGIKKLLDDFEQEANLQALIVPGTPKSPGGLILPR